ncbi:unnamed protein product [Closterium sp. NIES-53]
MSLVLRTSGPLLLVRSAAAARARVAGVVAVAVGVVVRAAVEVVGAVEVVAAVGVVAGVGALVAAVEAVVGVAVVAAVGVVAVELELRAECGASGGSVSCPYVIRTGDRAGQTCGKLHTQNSCFSHLDNTWRAEFGDEVERPRWAELLRTGVAKLDLVLNSILAPMYALSASAEGDCYLCVPPDPCIEAAALGASESVLPGLAPAEALHTFTLDSGASHCFFRDTTTLTPFSAPLLVRLADPSGGPVLARSSTVLPCLAVPSASLSGLHLPSFSTNLGSTTALEDAMVTTNAPGSLRVSIYTCTGTGRHLATLTRQPRSSLYTFATKRPQVAASAQVSGSGQVLQRFSFQFSLPQPTPLSTGHSLSAPPSDESVEPSGPYPELVGCLMYLMTCTRPDFAYPLSILARYVAPGRHRKVHWDASKRVLRYLCSTSGTGLVLGGRGLVVLTGHADASWVDDSATQRSSHGYTFSLGSGSISSQSTRSSSVLSSSCEAEMYARAMAAQELRWLTYLLTDLGEQPRSPPVLYIDNKAMIALCQEHRLEHRLKHIALRYFLARELQQPGQLRLAYVATRANTADIFTKALPPACFAFLDWSYDPLVLPHFAYGAGILNGHGAGVQLGLAGRKNDGSGSSGALVYEPAAKSENVALRGASIWLRVRPGGVAEAREEGEEGAAKVEDMVLGPAKVAQDPLSSFRVLCGVAAWANEASEHADGVGKFEVGAHHGDISNPASSA